MRKSAKDEQILSPAAPHPKYFSKAADAVAELQLLYQAATKFLYDAFSEALKAPRENTRYRAFYPEIRITTTGFGKIDTCLSFGHVAEPGTYSTTVTRPDLFANYLTQQIALLIENHNVEVVIGVSSTPIPLHFAVLTDPNLNIPQEAALTFPLRDMFDVPDLGGIHDEIVNSFGFKHPDGSGPLAPFTAERIDYSLARLAHYTATDPVYFQNHVLFTNYQFYIDEFIAYARAMLADPNSGYTALVGPGNQVLVTAEAELTHPAKMPQMPSYHLTRKDNAGISLVNIGVGPSNAKTATDHIAVLRPHAWLMVGHCAGLRNTQALGDYVLAHAYLREDHVLDDDLPAWVPIPALAEVQIALEDAVADVAQVSGYELKRIMRTGTVATIDNRNWELRDQSGPVKRLSQSRAIALDMESATIAANGFRFRVPYGTLLCVSDKPLHGELKLPGTASEFYKTQVTRHLLIGIRAMEKLREMPLERLHSRKLRSFEETAFL